MPIGASNPITCKFRSSTMAPAPKLIPSVATLTSVTRQPLLGAYVTLPASHRTSSKKLSKQCNWTPGRALAGSALFVVFSLNCPDVCRSKYSWGVLHTLPVLPGPCVKFVTEEPNSAR
eukprot:7389587-Prymnesium_polylepis.2